MFLDPFLTHNGVALFYIGPDTGRVFAAYEKGIVLETRDEDDAAIFLDAEFVRTDCVSLDILPLGGSYLVDIEEFVVATNYNPWLTFRVFGCEKASRIGW